MMGSGDREADQLLVQKDWHAKGDVRSVRRAPVGVVVHDDVAWADRSRRACCKFLSDPSDIAGDWAGLERGAHLALAKLASVRVSQRGAEILGLADNARVGHAHEFVAHLDRNVFERAVDNRGRHRIDAGCGLGVSERPLNEPSLQSSEA